MKKFFIYTFAICAAFLASCSKDSSSSGSSSGNPSTGIRIGEIYRSRVWERYTSDDGYSWELVNSGYSENKLSTVFHWNNDKIISIDHYSDNQYHGSDVFTYNNNGLVSKVTFNEEGEEYENVVLSYNGTQISTVKFYRDGIMQSAYNVSYSNNKITRLTCTYMTHDTLESVHGRDFFKNMFKTDPKDISATDDMPYIVLTWSGNNLTRLQRYNSGGEYYETFTYDNKINPYCGVNSLAVYVLFRGNFSYLSQNNVLYDDLHENGYTYPTTYTYIYNGNYPVQYSFTEEYVTHNRDSWFKYVDTYTFTNSYLE